jgi:integrase
MKKKVIKTKGLYLRKKTWWMTFQGCDGKQHWASCHTQSKIEAQALLEKRRVSVREGNAYEAKQIKPTSFLDLAKEYEQYVLKQRSYISKKGFLKKLKAQFGSVRLTALNTRIIEQYQTTLIKSGLKPASVNRILAALKHMINKAVEWEMAPEDVLKSVRRVKQLAENNRRLRFLSGEEMARLIHVCDQHLKPIVITALNTGMRKGEILSLTWEQVDLRHGFILLDVTKNGERREIPINNVLRETLTSLPRHLTSPYVFWQGNEGTRFLDVKKSFASALKRAGIRDFHFHDLRHTFASQLVMAGADLVTVKELLGHKTLAMTMRYSHIAPGQKVVAVSLLDSLHDNYMTM